MDSYTYSRINNHILALAEIGENPSECGCDTCYSLISRTSSAPRPRILGKDKPLDPLPGGKTIRRRRSKRGGVNRPRPNSKTLKRVRALDKVCRYCLIGPAETVDHVLPLSRGGSNRQINLVGCCSPCNEKKDDKTPKEAGLVLHIPLRFFSL